MRDALFILMQYLVPQHLVSRLVGRLANSRRPFLKIRFIGWFAKRYSVNMDEAAQSDLAAYDTFNSFFTRALKPDARPLLGSDQDVICPADGAISQLGLIEGGSILQAKGRHYSVQALLGGDTTLAQTFTGGNFATVYLSPRDYHRVHMPVTGRLRKMIYVPGQLFSVNKLTSERVDGLFARNERVVCIFDTDSGPMALVLVGAMIVAGVETVWSGHVCPDQHVPFEVDYTDANNPVVLQKGDEMGRFKLGSTVIAVFGPDMLTLNALLSAGSAVSMGHVLGSGRPVV
ncbi:MAG: archaetidylserine decarboxylase [Pseudohongiella sp.]|nr:archaetidylserine decarboxylase [Pseudohongiella sp.]